MAWILVLAAYAAYFVSDMLPAIKAHKARVLWPCAALLLFGFFVQMATEFQIPLPSPVGVFTGLFSGWAGRG